MVMSLMMGHFSTGYGLDFLMQTTKPDIYVMEFKEDEVLVRRMLV